MKIEYFQTIRKREFEENPKIFLTAGHLVFLRPFLAAGHIHSVHYYLLTVGFHAFLLRIKRILHVFKFFKPCKKSGLSTGFASGLSGESNASLQIKLFSLFYQ